MHEKMREHERARDDKFGSLEQNLYDSMGPEAREPTFKQFCLSMKAVFDKDDKPDTFRIQIREFEYLILMVAPTLGKSVRMKNLVYNLVPEKDNRIPLQAWKGFRRSWGAC